MPTERVSGSKQLSVIPLPIASPPIVLSFVGVAVNYNLCVGKGTLCQQIDVSPKLDHGVVEVAA